MATELGVGYISVLPSAKGFGKALDAEIGGVGKTVGSTFSNDFGNTIDKETKKSGKLGKAFDGIAKAGGAAFAVFAGAKVFTSFTDEAEEARKVAKQTEAVIKSMGGVANVSAKDVDKLASSLAAKAGIDDDVIASAQNVLLTFGNVRNEVGKGNDIFTQATASALDMSVALGTDLQSANVMLGKALNDPIKGITAMTKAGVSFSQQQKDQIKAMVESGDTLGAQKIILGEMEKQFGGSAEAGATGSAKMGVAFGEIKEMVGTLLLPVLDKVSAALTWFSSNQPAIVIALGAVAVGFAVWATNAAIAAAATLAAAAPFIAIGAAIAALVAGVILAYQNIDWFRAAVDAVKEWIVNDFVPALTAAWEWIRDAAIAAWPTISAIIQGTADVITAIVKWIVDDGIPAVVTAFEFVEEVVKKVWPAVQAIITNVIDVIIAYVTTWWTILRTAVETGIAAVITAFKVISSIVTWVNDYVISPIQTAWSAFFGVLSAGVTTGISVVSTAWGALQNFVQWTKNYVITPITTAFGTFWGALKTGFEIAVAAVKTAWDVIKEVVKAPVNFVIDPVYSSIKKVWDAIPGIGDLPVINKFASGGWVPGSGNRDTVPALLTPGEFVVTKKAADVWGPEVLSLLNKPKGTIDPAVFGYAAGGYVRSAAEALEWAQAQSGKPYEFPMVGPGSYDCSGFLSAVLNYIYGRNPHSRLFSSGTVGVGTAGLAAGAGNPGTGFTMGVDRPAGRPVGHVAATLMGTNIEATPPRVRIGTGARGWDNSLFGEAFHLPDFGGLDALSESLARDAGGILGIKFPDLGEWGSHIFGAVKSVLGEIVATVMRNIPGIKQIGAAVDYLSTTNPFGGTYADYDWSSGKFPWEAASGGIVQGGRGGVPSWIGEGTRDELVAPLPYGFDIADLGGPTIINHFNVEGNIYGDVELDRRLDEFGDEVRQQLASSIRS